MAKSWFKKGDEGASYAKDEDERRQAKFSENNVRRFWLAPDKSTQITLLDSTGFFLSEHQLYLDGSWQNWATCLKDIAEDGICPLCEAGHNPSYICVFTIIDHTKFTTKKGVKVKASKRLLVLKSNARNKMLKQKERRDGELSGCKFEVTRYTKKEASTGLFRAV